MERYIPFYMSKVGEFIFQLLHFIVNGEQVFVENNFEIVCVVKARLQDNVYVSWS